MSTVWSDSPSVPLLQWLARVSLKQNLPQAVRLWVWLHLLYGKPEVRLDLPEPFTYTDWRDAFFTATHTKGEEKPALHDPNCPCTKVTAAWLFGNLTWNQAQWEQGSAQSDQSLQQQVQAFERSLQQHGALPPDLQTFLFKTRLFGMTRRTLYNDLQVLVEIHWLRRIGQGYHRVAEFPVRPSATVEETESRLMTRELAFLTHPDLAAIADSLSQNLNGQRRFFVHVEYVVSPDLLDRVDEWQNRLRQWWQQDPVPPILLTYQQAGSEAAVELVVYPVCLYYYQRGPYLCAFGQVPQGSELDWRNYRLDRIESLTPLTWSDARIPPPLLRQYRQGTLPSSDEIQIRMEDAWGFDYYQPAELLLIRFDREWDQRYIQNTMRHSTFEPVEYEEAGALIRQALKGKQQKALLKIWRSRSEQDAYYQAQYRRDDPNVRQRLRAWRPHVEVLLPWELRQRMTWEVEQEWRWYHDADNSH